MELLVSNGDFLGRLMPLLIVVPPCRSDTGTRGGGVATEGATMPCVGEAWHAGATHDGTFPGCVPTGGICICACVCACGWDWEEGGDAFDLLVFTTTPFWGGLDVSWVTAVCGCVVVVLDWPLSLDLLQNRVGICRYQALITHTFTVHLYMKSKIWKTFEFIMLLFMQDTCIGLHQMWKIQVNLASKCL